jgi:hypothetical protein
MFWVSYSCNISRGGGELIPNRSDVDDVRQKLTVLQPVKGSITNILIMGTFKWQDT